MLNRFISGEGVTNIEGVVLRQGDLLFLAVPSHYIRVGDGVTGSFFTEQIMDVIESPRIAKIGLPPAYHVAGKLIDRLGCHLLEHVLGEQKGLEEVTLSITGRGHAWSERLKADKAGLPWQGINDYEIILSTRDCRVIPVYQR